MKILFLGDSITDMGRVKEFDGTALGYGCGYPQHVAGMLINENPTLYEVVNRGVGGNKIVDLYARMKVDVWNHEPDVLSILIGINDIWQEIDLKDGVDIIRYEKVYRAIIEETKERLPNIKIMLCEPFVLEGSATTGEKRFERFLEIHEYAKVVKRLAEEYGCVFVPLQEKFDEKESQGCAKKFLYDGVHADAAGAKLIADEWMKSFKTLL